MIQSKTLDQFLVGTSLANTQLLPENLTIVVKNEFLVIERKQRNRFVTEK
jgi:hypothetical protein